MAYNSSDKGGLPLNDGFSAIKWHRDSLILLDQRVLPSEESYLSLDDVRKVAQAITDMVVRGAPAIGITAAYGAVLSLQKRLQESPDDWRIFFSDDMDMLEKSRPTAINLRWAINRMTALMDKFTAEEAPEKILAVALDEARRIHDEDIAANRKMGELGAALIEPGSGVVTHCNTGGLATGGIGTALGVIRTAYAESKLSQVFASETRPWLQGARLTAWELQKAGIDAQLIVEGASASLMRAGKVQWVIVGADRIAANGDAANKIGTYTHAVVARHHGVKFMVVAPLSTIDWDTASGEAIPIEQRPAREITYYRDTVIAPDQFDAWNPAFDVTPAELISAIVTEAGVVENPDAEKMRLLLNG